ncbi:hypothetical protein IRJ41_019886 [Triplophysa rosa]|uniref:Ig-like domain-containing protein n=1 Tax=Triplophysa rosa TaxID=992332 RepID=A0A9W7WXB6_TRIRA|nr:hypothetical protein IRJ41_019886 [Triplophysa rosa]
MTHWKSHLIIFITHVLGCNSQDSVEQNTRVQTAFEGTSVTINCTYKTSDPSPYLYWYQQHLKEIPENMMMIFAANVQHEKDFQERFHTNHNRSSRSVPLIIQDVCSSSKMTYGLFILLIFIFHHYGSFGKDAVNQPKEERTVIEREQMTLNCEYESIQDAPYLYWYIQRSNKHPEYILMRYKYGSSNSSEFKDRFDARLDTRSVPLIIGDVDVSDSAVYYCALKPTVTKHTQHSHKNTILYCQQTIALTLIIYV